MTEDRKNSMGDDERLEKAFHLIRKRYNECNLTPAARKAVVKEVGGFAKLLIAGAKNQANNEGVDGISEKHVTNSKEELVRSGSNKIRNKFIGSIGGILLSSSLSVLFTLLMSQSSTETLTMVILVAVSIIGSFMFSFSFVHD